MLFNSYEFIFVFLPAAVLIHFAAARWSVEAAIAATALSSLAFYAWWNPPFVVLLGGSILVNFVLASRMARVEKATARVLLICGIVVNLAVLVYFKYAAFLLSIVRGGAALPPNVPLALSFTTFVQIAFLTDMYRRRTNPPFGQYALFVAFFPHLIAGPIVRWSNLGRQLPDPARYRLDWDNVALGLTIFVLGLAKKVLIADQLAPHVGVVFDAAARGDPLTALAAWAACFGFSAQIYFDFSGYSDMAVGLGLLFNYRLPINFAAPLRATNALDFWRRWHITLSQFLRDFVYGPLTFGRPALWWRAIAIMITMVLAGLWHGAGWPFVLWGAFHGVLLLVNVAWHMLPKPGRPSAAGRFAGWALTFTAFAASSVFFRGTDMGAIAHMLTAMAGRGAGAFAVPESYEWAVRSGYSAQVWLQALSGLPWFSVGMVWIAGALAVALLVPDTMELVGYREGEVQSAWRRVAPFAWRPSPAMLGAAVVLFAAVFYGLGRVSEFLYFQF
jgi:D-alanyl-lipoteichoic acid acyltransferase DltB (MBOAT superfamily)